MADTPEPTDADFDNPPRGVKPGQLRTAWQNRVGIWAKTAEGKTPSQIYPVYHVPLAALDWVNARRPAPPTDNDSGSRIGTGSPEPGSEPGSASQPAAENPPRGVDDRQPRASPQNRPERATPGGQGADQPGTAEPFRPISAPGPDLTAGKAPQPMYGGGPDLSAMGSMIPGPRFGAKFEVPDVYQSLYNLCIAYGVQAPQAEGIVWSYQNQSDPTDMNALRRLLTIAGKNKIVTEEIVNGWATIIRRMGDESGVPMGPRDAKAVLEDVQKRLGMTTEQSADPMMMDVEDLKKQQLALEIEKTREEMAERRRQMRERSGAATAGAEEDMIDILLDVNGMPTPRRIRASALPMYQPFIARPRDAGPAQPEGPPDWFKPYADKIATDAEERRIERSRREQQEAVAAAVGPLQEQLKQLKEGLAGNPQQSALEAKYDALVRQLQDQTAKETQSRFDRMEAMIRSSNNPDAALSILDRERAIAGRMGMVPASSVGKLEEEQVQLEAEREANKSRSSAQTEAFHVLTDRAKEKPVMTMAREAKLPQLVGEVLKQRVGGLPENQGDLVEQSPEHMAEAAAQLERQAGAAAPPGDRPPPRGRQADGTEGIVVG